MVLASPAIPGGRSPVVADLVHEDVTLAPSLHCGICRLQSLR